MQEDRNEEMKLNLIPCPGPHIMLLIFRLEHPSTIEIQSSPAFSRKFSTILTKIKITKKSLSFKLIEMSKITSSNSTMVNGNVSAARKMNTISIWTFCWGVYGYVWDSSRFGVLNMKMNVRVVLKPQSAYTNVLAMWNIKSLQNKPFIS